jgi:hypothetical protein
MSGAFSRAIILRVLLCSPRQRGQSRPSLGPNGVMIVRFEFEGSAQVKVMSSESTGFHGSEFSLTRVKEHQRYRP